MSIEIEKKGQKMLCRYLGDMLAMPILFWLKKLYILKG